MLLIVSAAAFSLMLILPGDPVIALMGLENLNVEELESIRHELGLDRPIPVQYADWLGGVLQGDWGRSVRTNEPVLDMIVYRLPVTLQLGVVAWVISLAIGIPAGIVSALRRNSSADIVATVTAMIGVAMPSFWLAILMIMLFSVRLGWLPPSGFMDIWEDPVRSLKLLAMPAITLGVGMSAMLMRQTRSSMLEVLEQDYIRTARAKGLSERVVVIGHALRNALIPVVTVIGIQLTYLLSGSVIVEQIFAIPGIGRLAVNSIYGRDFPAVQGVVLFMGFAVVVLNLVVDIIYGYLDPRIRYN